AYLRDATILLGFSRVRFCDDLLGAAKIPVHPFNLRWAFLLFSVFQRDWRVELRSLKTRPRLQRLVWGGCDDSTVENNVVRIMTPCGGAAGLPASPGLTLDSERSQLQLLTLNAGQLVAVDPIVIVGVTVHRCIKLFR